MTDNIFEPFENSNENNTEVPVTEVPVQEEKVESVQVDEPKVETDFTPDEYYEKTYGSTANSADEYAKYGEDYYTNPQRYTQQNSTPQGDTNNPYQNPYQNNYGNPYQSNPYVAYPYGQNPYAKAPTQKVVTPKVKKESKPVTKKFLAVVLVVAVLCSAILGTIGGVCITKLFDKTETIVNNGLSITKTDNESGSKVESGAVLSTREIVEKTADSVVEITTEAVVTGSFSQQYIQEGAGSGVIISTDGYIITNYHVIAGASQISITLRNSTEPKSARVIGAYEEGDLALIKIETKEELKPAVFGNSDKLNVGDYAVAIGNPLGQLGGTVTDGIISALDREVNIDGETMNLLQTNAEISPGNSGGGLFNGAGELIGIVNAKSATQSAEGLGFAIPINDVQDVLSDLKEYGYVTGQVYLGLSLVDISSTAEAWMYGATQAGVYVASVDNGSNAAEAGFYGGDIILEVNGTAVSTTAEVEAIIDKLSVGDKVSFKVNRNGQTGTLKMELEEYSRKVDTGRAQQSQQPQQDMPSIWDFFE